MKQESQDDPGSLTWILLERNFISFASVPIHFCRIIFEVFSFRFCIAHVHVYYISVEQNMFKFHLNFLEDYDQFFWEQGYNKL